MKTAGLYKRFSQWLTILVLAIGNWPDAKVIVTVIRAMELEPKWITCRSAARASMSKPVTSAGKCSMPPTNRHKIASERSKCLWIHERANMDSLFAGLMPRHTELSLKANSFLTCLSSIVEAKLVCRIQGSEEQKPHDRSSNNSTLVRRRCWGLRSSTRDIGGDWRRHSVCEHPTHGNSFEEHRWTSQCQQTSSLGQDF